MFNKSFAKADLYYDINKGAKDNYIHSVLVNFMCQLVWAMVPSSAVKHYFGCFYKDIFS